MKRALAAVGLSIAVAFGGAVLGVPTAQAHSELVASDPADGASLDAPPASVSFTFNEDLMPDFVRLIVKSPAGVTGDLPVTAVDGPTVTADWPADAEGGEWKVNYRVVSQDGHPVEGGITFSYDGPAPTSSGPLPTSASPTSAEPTTVTPSPPAPTSAAPSPSASPAADSSSAPSTIVIAGIAVGLIVIIGVVIALVARRRP